MDPERALDKDCHEELQLRVADLGKLRQVIDALLSVESRITLVWAGEVVDDSHTAAENMLFRCRSVALAACESRLMSTLMPTNNISC